MPPTSCAKSRKRGASRARNGRRPSSRIRVTVMLIRKAERRDLDALGRLGAMLMRAHYAFDRQRFLAPGEGVEQAYGSFLASVIESADDCVFVAEQEGGAIAGYVYVALEPHSWKELRGPAGFIHDLA